PLEPTCPNGHRGALVRIEARRLSGAFVVLGFTLFVVALLGVGLGSIGVVFVTLLERAPAQSAAESRQELQKAAVPEKIAADIPGEGDDPPTFEALRALPPPQVEAVKSARLAALRRNVDLDELRRESWTFAGAALAGAALGWWMRSK